MTKYQDNSRVKRYYHKIKAISKAVNIVSFDVFEKTYSQPDQEILFLDNGLFRLSNIIKGHKAELHGYIFGHRILREVNKFVFMLKHLCEAYSLYRVECVVDLENRGLQKMLSRVNFKNEGIRENGVFLNGLCKDGLGYVYIR